MILLKPRVAIPTDHRSIQRNCLPGPQHRQNQHRAPRETTPARFRADELQFGLLFPKGEAAYAAFSDDEGNPGETDHLRQSILCKKECDVCYLPV
jgi:hypothetical protein